MCNHHATHHGCPTAINHPPIDAETDIMDVRGELAKKLATIIPRSDLAELFFEIYDTDELQEELDKYAQLSLFPPDRE